MNLTPQREDALHYDVSLEEKSWNRIKTFKYPNCFVDTFSYTKNCAKWFVRKSVIDASQYPFELFVKYLVGDEDTDQHTEYEAQYISLVKKYTSKKTSVPNCYLATVEYKFDPPLSDREFNEYIIPVQPKTLENGDHEAFVVSVVADVPLQNKRCVLAAYASIEKIRYIKATNQVEWIMSTSSDAGGFLPQWIQNLAVPKSISHDVPSFLNWLDKIHPKVSP